MVRIVVLILGLVVIVFGVLPLVGSAIPGVTDSERFVRSFAVEPGEALLIQGINGRITYEPWGGDEVVIEATRIRPRFLAGVHELLWGEITVDFSRDEGGVKAVAEPSRSWLVGAVPVEFDVKVPRGWHGGVRLTTSDGAIAAAEIHGDVELETSNGAIRITGHQGQLSASTSNGSLYLTDVHGVVEAQTSNGRITFLDGTLKDNGQLRTRNGAVELRARLEPGADYDVNASNSSVTLTLLDPDVALDLRTSNGSINLQTEVKASVIERSRIVGTIGEGVSRLNVRTRNGSITLAAIESNE